MVLSLAYFYYYLYDTARVGVTGLLANACAKFHSDKLQNLTSKPISCTQINFWLIAQSEFWSQLITERSPSPNEKRLHFLADLRSQSEFRTQR